MFPFASPLEFVQTAMSFCGVLLLSWALWDALRDVVVLQAAGVNGARLLLARSNLRTEIAKLCVVMVLIVGGVISILLPPPTSLNEGDPQVAPLIELAQKIDARIIQENRLQRLTTVATRVVAMLVTFILVLDSILARRVRRQFIRRVGDRGLSDRGQRGERGEQGSRGATGAPGPAGAAGAAGAPAVASQTPGSTQVQIDVIEKDVREIKARQIDVIEADAKEIKQDVKDIKKDVKGIIE